MVYVVYMIVFSAVHYFHISHPDPCQIWTLNMNEKRVTHTATWKTNVPPGPPNICAFPANHIEAHLLIFEENMYSTAYTQDVLGEQKHIATLALMTIDGEY